MTTILVMFSFLNGASAGAEVSPWTDVTPSSNTWTDRTPSSNTWTDKTQSSNSWNDV